VPKLSKNFEEILPRVNVNFEEENKVLESSMIIIIIIIIIVINAFYNYIIAGQRHGSAAARLL
jgi:hypothetical protein